LERFEVGSLSGKNDVRWLGSTVTGDDSLDTSCEVTLEALDMPGDPNDSRYELMDEAVEAGVMGTLLLAAGVLVAAVLMD
jgi:hypothetical protein